jgi:hypothetical protein
MKRMIVLVTFCVVMQCVWISGAVGQTKTSYLMVCKGGGDMVAWIEQNYISSDVRVVVYVTFRASPQAASRQEPAPGTCAWVDRPLSAIEQRDLSLAYQWQGEDVPVHRINLHHGRAEALLDASSVPIENLRYLLDAVYNGKLFYVHCYHNQYDHNFRMTGLGP